MPPRLLLLSLVWLIAGGFSSCKHEPAVAPAAPPAELQYSPNGLTLTVGTAGSSAAPTVLGAQPLRYTLTSEPAQAGLTVEPSTGVISVSDQVPVGTYAVTITATNAAGSTTFADAFTVTVGPVAITFTNHVRPLVVSACGNCHSGGAFTDYTIYANAAANIGSLLDRVQRPPGTRGYMPLNRPPLTTDQVALLKQWQAQGLKP